MPTGLPECSRTCSIKSNKEGKSPNSGKRFGLSMEVNGSTIRIRVNFSCGKSKWYCAIATRAISSRGKTCWQDLQIAVTLLYLYMGARQWSQKTPLFICDNA